MWTTTVVSVSRGSRGLSQAHTHLQDGGQVKVARGGDRKVWPELGQECLQSHSKPQPWSTIFPRAQQACSRTEHPHSLLETQISWPHWTCRSLC